MIDIDNMNKLDEDGLFITDKYVFFYGSALSNFQITNFLYTDFGETHRFFTSEQAFMWVKAKQFGDEETAYKILNENLDPMACKKLGRQVKNYNEEEWDKVRYDVFFKVNLEKFTQDEKMTKFILQDKFEGKTFVEASPYDGVWGVCIPIGDPAIADEKNWRGRNLLGKCLTEVRAAVKEKQKDASSVKKVHLTWQDIESRIDNLAKLLEGNEFDAVLSIGRGGMIPARLLAEKFDIHAAYIIDAKAYTADDKLGDVQVSDIRFAPDVHKILVVDDCIFTGTTLDAVMKKISENEQITDITNAFLYMNTKISKIFANFVYSEPYDGSTTWLVFPWEN